MKLQFPKGSWAEKNPKLALLFVAIAIFSIFRFYLRSQIKKNKDESFYRGVELNKQINSDYYAMLSTTPAATEETPYIQHLRIALNNYMNGSTEGLGVRPEKVIEPDKISESRIGGLKSFDNSYYQNKFVVLRVQDVGSSKVIVIFFPEKPDMEFTTNVMYYNEKYSLIDFYGRPLEKSESQFLQSQYSALLKDPMQSY